MSFTNEYWNIEIINKLPHLIIYTDRHSDKHLGIGWIDKVNKIIYKEHYVTFKKTTFNDKQYLNIDMKPELPERTNIQIFVKKNNQSISSESEQLPSIGLSYRGILTEDDRDYKVIIKLYISHPKGKWIQILTVPFKKFIDSEYSNKFFGDYNGRSDYNTEKLTQKEMRHDYQKFVPIREFEILDSIIETGEIVNLDYYFKIK